MALSLADILADESTSHAFALFRVAGHLRLDALGHLEALVRDLKEHAAKYAKLPNSTGAGYRALEKQAARIITGAYTLLAKGQLSDLTELAKIEAGTIPAHFNKALWAPVFGKTLDIGALNAIVRGRILEGHPLSSWWDGQRDNIRRRFNGEMAKGILLGESVPQMVERVAGKDGLSGLTKKARADITALVRTSVLAVSNEVNIETMKAMKTVKGIRWLATLDGRTTKICLGLHLKWWSLPDYVPQGHTKKFPGSVAHVNCRSRQTAVTYTWEELAGRKLPEVGNDDLEKTMRRKLEEQGKTAAQIEATITNAKNTINGAQSPATFAEWAATKKPAELAQIMGKGRFDLFNSGKIAISDLTDQNNRPLTLEQLRALVEDGKTPPETLGKGVVPVKTTSPADMARVQEIAQAARSEAEEKATRAVRVAHETVNALAADNSKTYGGPFQDGFDALAAAKDKTPEERKAIFDKVTKDAAKEWLSAWEQGFASPHDESGAFSATRVRAWEKYAKGKPATPDTWKALLDGYEKELGSMQAAAAIESSAAKAQAALIKATDAATAGDKRKMQAALLDAQAAAVDVQSRIAENNPDGPTAKKPAFEAPRRTPAPGTDPAPAKKPSLGAGRPATVEDALSAHGVSIEGQMNARQADALITSLAIKKPAKLASIIDSIAVPPRHDTLSVEFVEAAVADFVKMVPPDVLAKLPKLRFVTEYLDGGTPASYESGGLITLGQLSGARADVRRNIFHELTHWIHLELPADDPWVQSISDHFNERTRGEKIVTLGKDSTGRVLSQGKRDKFFEAYMGRYYFDAIEAERQGVEFPTMALELLSDPVALAATWNKSPEARVDIALALRILFP